MVASVASGCSSLVGTDGNRATATFSADRPAYSLGDTAVVILRNVSDSNLGYNLCFSARERRTPTGWIRAAPLRICTAELRGLAPGASAELREHISEEWSPGEYRVVTTVEIVARSRRQEIVSVPFTVRNLRSP
jgi:hypothetical protein